MTIFDVFREKIEQNLPFKPNSSQKNALNLMSRFILEPYAGDRVFVLKGYAGTGKTSLVGALVKTLKELRCQ